MAIARKLKEVKKTGVAQYIVRPFVFRVRLDKMRQRPIGTLTTFDDIDVLAEHGHRCERERPRVGALLFIYA